jgi:hypothetical protein
MANPTNNEMQILLFMSVPKWKFKCHFILYMQYAKCIES